jgi:hypothetical protein
MTLGIGKIRGVESRGMLVSEFELEVSDNHEGIIELPDDAPVGASYAHWAGLDDPVIEINLTPNRADCAGVSGIARDLAAAGMGSLKAGSDRARARTLSLSDKCHARIWIHPLALSRVRIAAHSRSEERPVAAVAATPAHCDRTSPHKPSRRHHQFHHL